MRFDQYGVPIKQKGKATDMLSNRGVPVDVTTYVDQQWCFVSEKFKDLERTSKALYAEIVLGIVASVAAFFFFTVMFAQPSAGQGVVALLFFSIFSWVVAVPGLQSLNAFVAQPWRSLRIGSAVVGLLTTGTYFGIQIAFFVSWCADGSQQRIDFPAVDATCDDSFSTVLGSFVLACIFLGLAIVQIITEIVLHRYNLLYKNELLARFKAASRQHVKALASKMMAENKNKHAVFCRTYDVMYMCYYMPLELQNL